MVAHIAIGRSAARRLTAWSCLWLVGAWLVSQAAEHWAFEPVQAPALPTLPAGFESPRTPVDVFIFDRLAKHHAAPLPEAERRVLIRRLSFDLRGLPPSPEEIAAFLGDQRADAHERLVERFLASPQYGERWGRHWLDIAGYADSNGYFNADSDRPLAWKYRDYVVRSLNQDKPFDRFIREQVAGDELAGFVTGGDITPAMVEPLIATHFWRNVPDGTGESDGNPLEVKVDQYSVIEGNIQLIGSAFLGLTLQCARCHDHKFEPVTQNDYYALQAILRPVFNPDRWLKPNERAIAIGTKAEREKNQREVREHQQAVKTLKESLEGLAAPFRKQLLEENLATLEEAPRKELRAALDAKEKERTEAMKALLKRHEKLVKLEDAAVEKRFAEFAAAARPLREALKQREAKAPIALPMIAISSEPDGPAPVHHVLLRGNHAKEGPEQVPGVPRFLTRYANFEAAPATPRPTTGRRTQLADWLVSPRNPVVARMLVNRVWQRHFGTGLASTPDNLGKSGSAPAQPELLDWLAADFVRSGWSLKHLHRLIVNSATYRQAPVVAEGASTHRPQTGSAAPSSPAPLYAGFPLARLDAESLRDAMLAASGELQTVLGGPYVPMKTDKAGEVVIDEGNPGATRRSLYLQQRRTQPVNFLATFDGPAHNPVCIQRIQSTVALQSLSQLNSEFVRARAKAFARRLLGSAAKPAPGNAAPELQGAFELAWNRPATPQELRAATAFLAEQTRVYGAEPGARERVWTDFCQMLLVSNQFLYVE